MDSKSNWHTCRLAVQDSGRVRWCVGDEKRWENKMKKLVFLPIFLISIIILAIFITHVVTLEEEFFAGENRIYFDEDEIHGEEDRDIFQNVQTKFVDFPDDNEQIYDARRRRRAPYIDDFKAPGDYGEDKYLDVDKTSNDESYSIVEDNSARLQSFWREKLTPGEVRRLQAHTMMKYMDTTIDPCTDFYQYACGNWPKYNPIPADRAGYDTFEMLRENLDDVLRDLLTNHINAVQPPTDYLERDNLQQPPIIESDLYYNQNISTEGEAILKAKYLFESCMNEDILRKRGAAPLLRLLEKLGGWPVIYPEWNETNFDLVHLLGQLRLYNNDILISEWVGPDIKNSNEYIIQLDQTTLGLPTRDYYLESSNAKYVEAYRMYMITIASLLGAPIMSATKDCDDLVKFETDLAEITTAPELRRNVSEIYKRITLNDLYMMIPQINWFRYINIVMNREIDKDESIVCFCIPYFINLVDLLQRTPKRVIANYLLWRFIRHRSNNLDQRFDDAKQRFYHVLFGREKSPPRWQNCVSQVNSNLGMALGSMFVKKYFDETSKNDTLLMTKELQKAFKEILSNTSWLDDDTQRLACLKIDAMGLRIGYPNFIVDVHELAVRYKDIVIRPDYYFENIISILQHLTRIEQHRLDTAVNKTMWNTAPAVVNAYYSRNKNQIMFPAGILQPPFYHRFFPKCLNYGGIGVVIGHEITHGFDDKGRLFDKEGNLQKWWTEDSIDEFHDRSQCLIDQYNKFIVPEVNVPVDGINTQGENIADNGGVKQAYLAYTRWLSKNPTANETLPSMNITNKQLFFLNFAQIWCGGQRPEATKNKLKTAVHSPGRFRVIGTLSNSDEFAIEYNCPRGSVMNPIDKCNIW